MSVYRIYTEKKTEYAVESASMLSDIRGFLGITGVQSVRVIHRYDTEGVTKEEFTAARDAVFAQPATDMSYDDFSAPQSARVFAAALLPGQFDQNADSRAQMLQVITAGNRPKVKFARIYVIEGDITDKEFEIIKNYYINPVECYDPGLTMPQTLEQVYAEPEETEILTGFCDLDGDGLDRFTGKLGLAMDKADIAFCQDYFKNTEKREPTITEIRMIDTYWSDHCRHTTFFTNIKNADIKDEDVRASFEKYMDIRKRMGITKPVTMMDIATIAAKKMSQDGLLDTLDSSEEINACSVKIKAEIDGRLEDWLLMFKNETHNHPTEIEPFGGASTCVGGAIRDPLSGRSYVFAAMRITGSSDPLTAFDDTMPGKLPQYYITRTAAVGNSSYGNQSGLASASATEIYHSGYTAKRMELGALLGAAKAENVRRSKPAPGDVVLLLGEATGRDGCGGATGSSKSHNTDSLAAGGAEVQKGNPPGQLKIQRLFRNPIVSRMIKRCNDFGAGGVSVAIGELADGLDINLDKVPLKYGGMNATEIAISESQERMAVVVSAEDADRFVTLADAENLNCTPVAVVTESPRLVMTSKGKTVLNISREFLNSNGAVKFTDISVDRLPLPPINKTPDTQDGWKEHLSSLGLSSQKGIAEMFDFSAGSATVLAPYGGRTQSTPAQTMAVKIPVESGETTTAALMSWGFDPAVSSANPYLGAELAVIQSIANLVAAGGKSGRCWLSFQEYFERLGNDPARWGKPFSALLGALESQIELKAAAIGGKDSMSGSFEEIDVPPTLVSFAVTIADSRKVISPEFKKPGNSVAYICPEYIDGHPNFGSIREVFGRVESLIESGAAISVWSGSPGGMAEALSKMTFGNRVGFRFSKAVGGEELFNPIYGSFIVELDGGGHGMDQYIIGHTIDDYVIERTDGSRYCLDEIYDLHTKTLSSVFPCREELSFARSSESADIQDYTKRSGSAAAVKTAKPRVLIPVFPGANGEYQLAKEFGRQGAICETLVIKNRTKSDIEQSVCAMADAVKNSQIIAIPGGFSGGYEPDGAGRLIAAFLRQERIARSIEELIANRDGLILGICDGFHALMQTGLIPYGKFTAIDENSPALTANSIGRFSSMMTDIRVCSVKSPWMAAANVGDIFTLPFAHNAGMFVAGQEVADILAANGQIAAQYADPNGKPCMDLRYNPAGSIYAAESLTSPDGRILGKMTHPERTGSDIYKNIIGEGDMGIFKSGVGYWR
ncbi:MAG: phosphoribosylformylglycinamidine synthase [Oscillospiraceae bacterium]|nr:phosphoribosylformylglycinamidine synthase [Oscillospiraceae bacterium]